MQRTSAPVPISMMLFGTLIFLGSLAAWEVGELHGIDTTVLWPVATPVIMALFIASPLGKAADSAAAAASQTNGGLEGRVEAAVAKALAQRDAARTRQAVGDISTPQRAINDENENTTP